MVDTKVAREHCPAGTTVHRDEYFAALDEVDRLRGELGVEMDRTSAARSQAASWQRDADVAENKLTAALAKNVELACANQALRAGVRCLRDALTEAEEDLSDVPGKLAPSSLQTVMQALTETADLAPAQEAPMEGTYKHQLFDSGELHPFADDKSPVSDE